jgi:hypothetical protein
MLAEESMRLELLKILCPLLLLGVSASAAPLTWTLDGEFFGAAVSGSFVYDSDLNIYSSIRINTAEDPDKINFSFLRGAASYTFLNPLLPAGPTGASFVTTNAADLTGTPNVDLSYYIDFGLNPAALTNAGGVIIFRGEETDWFRSPPERFGEGTLTAFAGSSVPEPATVISLALGIAMLGAARLRVLSPIGPKDSPRP